MPRGAVRLIPRPSRRASIAVWVRPSRRWRVASRREHGVETIVLSGGVFQNALLLAEIRRSLEPGGLEIWVNHQVPPNDGGVSLGQAALAAVGRL